MVTNARDVSSSGSCHAVWSLGEANATDAKSVNVSRRGPGHITARHEFTVRACLPEPLAALHELAYNLRWSWDERTRDLFRWVDPELWESSFDDPVRLLGRVSLGRLEKLAGDSAFVGFLK